MKRIIFALLATSLVLAVAGCAFEKSYYLASGGTVDGFCYQVTTNVSGIQRDLTTAGWVVGTCDDAGFVSSNYCTYTETSGTESYEISLYWGSSYDPAEIETACTSSGWTFH